MYRIRSRILRGDDYKGFIWSLKILDFFIIWDLFLVNNNVFYLKYENKVEFF